MSITDKAQAIKATTTKASGKAKVQETGMVQATFTWDEKLFSFLPPKVLTKESGLSSWFIMLSWVPAKKLQTTDKETGEPKTVTISPRIICTPTDPGKLAAINGAGNKENGYQPVDIYIDVNMADFTTYGGKPALKYFQTENKKNGKKYNNFVHNLFLYNWENDNRMNTANILKAGLVKLANEYLDELFDRKNIAEVGIGLADIK